MNTVSRLHKFIYEKVSNRISHFPKNDAPPVPEIQGKAKHGNEKARPIIETESKTPLKVFHD